MIGTIVFLLCVHLLVGAYVVRSLEDHRLEPAASRVVGCRRVWIVLGWPLVVVLTVLYVLLIANTWACGRVGKK